LRLGSDPRGDIVDLGEDAVPFPVGRSNAEEVLCNQLPAGRTPGDSRPAAGGVAFSLPRYALTPLGNRPPRPWGSV
jgi:hypothetical protein